MPSEVHVYQICSQLFYQDIRDVSENISGQTESGWPRNTAKQVIEKVVEKFKMLSSFVMEHEETQDPKL